MLCTKTARTVNTVANYTLSANEWKTIVDEWDGGIKMEEWRQKYQ